MRLTLGRLVAAWGASSLIASCVYSIAIAAGQLVLDLAYGTSGGFAFAGFLFLVISAPLFVMGIGAVGVPLATLLVRTNKTGRLTAIIGGAAPTTLVGGLLIVAIIAPDWPFVAGLIAGLPFAGAAGGLAFRAALDKQPTPPPAPPS